MNKYARSLAEVRGTIECRDLAAGDVILARLNGGTLLPHKLTSAERVGSDVHVTFECGTRHVFTARGVAGLVSLGAECSV